MGLLENAAGAAAGQGMGLIFGEMQDRRQLKQARRLQELQMQGQRGMALTNFDLQKRMWDETNTEAQVEHMKNAGINPATMYGTGGGGNATVGNQGGNVSGQSAGDPNEGIGMGLQMASQIALMKAQKENIEADTENKKAGAGKAVAEAAGQGIENQVATNTQRSKELKIGADAQIAAEEASMATTRNEILKATTEDQKNIIKAEAIGKILENKLTTAKTGLTNQQAEEVAESIKQEWSRIILEGRKVTADELYKATMQSVARKGVGIASDALDQKIMMDGVNTALGIGSIGMGNLPTETKKEGYNETFGNYYERTRRN